MDAADTGFRDRTSGSPGALPLDAVTAGSGARFGRELWLASLIGLVAVAAGGWLFVNWFTHYGASLERSALLKTVTTTAAAIEPDLVVQLGGRPSDADLPAFQHTRATLRRIHEAATTSRFVYLLRVVGDDVTFLLDAEPPDLEDYSAPGDVYADASPELRGVFTTKVPIVEGPASDQWGTWVSGIAPIADPQTGAVVALFGIDIDATEWEAGVARYRWLGTAIAGLMAGIIIFLGLIVILQHRSKAASAVARRIIETSPAILYRFAVTPGYPMIYVSGNIARLGYDPAAFVASQTYGDIIHPEDREVLRESVRRMVEGESSAESVRFRLRARDGSYRWFDSSETPLRDARGRLIALEGILIDVTERQAAEERVRENEGIIEGLVSQGFFGVYIVDEDGRNLFVNDQLAKLIGYVLAEYEGQPFLSYIADSDKPAVADAMRALLAGEKESVEVTAGIRRRDGSRVDILSRGTLTTYRGQRAIIGVVVDITATRQAEERVRQSEAAMAEAQALAHIGSWTFDIRTGTVTWSREVYRIYGIEPGTLMPSYSLVLARTHRDDRAAFEAIYAASVGSHEPFTLENRIVRDDGSIRFVRATGRTIYDHFSRPVRSIGSLQDITERKAEEEEILFANTLLKTQMETLPDGILVVDAQGQVISFNQRFADMWRVPLATLRAGDNAPVLAAVTAAVKNSEAFLARVRYLYDHREISARDELETRDGRFVDRHTAPLRAPSGTYLGRVWFFRDVTDRKEAEAQILRNARSDDLTGLVNRAVFMETIHQAMARARRGEKGFAVLYIDLDHFKDVNDTLGHPVGDELLKSVAARLKSVARASDTVARFGGDEFAVIASDVNGPDDAAVLAEALLAVLAEPFAIDGNEIRSGASMGIAVDSPDLADAETLLSQADVALYRAKAEGRGDYRFFTAAMDAEVRYRVTMSAELREAIAADQLFLLYQPQVRIETAEIVGVEALVRWRHPERGILRPGAFMHIAELSGLIYSLGHFVLMEACRQQVAWIAEGIAPASLSVNLSAMQFKRPAELEKDIVAVLAETGLPPSFLELELTETVLMEASREHNGTLLRLRDAGVRLAIDDFGTGYSSLDYLRRFPTDRIKIAQDFVGGIGTAPHNDAIVKATIGLARELGIAIIAEGVETHEQLTLLKNWGCREVQGYYFAQPLSPAEIEPVLRAGRIMEAGGPTGSTAA